MSAPLAPNRRADIQDPGSGVECPPLSFEAVYQENFDFAWRSLRRLGVPAMVLEDAVQDVFMVVSRRLAEFEHRSSVRTWIFSIAIRVAKDFARRAARHRRDASTDAPGEPRHPHELAEQSEAVRLLDELLGKLNEDKRAVFVLAELEQMTVPEIAAAVGANPNTVYTRLRGARMAFSEALRQHRSGEPARGGHHGG